MLVLRLALALLPVGLLTAAEVSVSTAGAPAFNIDLPAGWTVTTKDAKTVIYPGAKHPHIQVWATDATDVQAAEKSVAKLIESEVTHFAPVTSEDKLIAMAPARFLVGTGEEADDGDPSNAEVTLFTVKQTVYVLVSHAEGDGAAKMRQELVRALTTVTPAK
jgi:hypothetical protein